MDEELAQLNGEDVLQMKQFLLATQTVDLMDVLLCYSPCTYKKWHCSQLLHAQD